MSLIKIVATFECDGCSRKFLVGMDPAGKIPGHWTLFEAAQDWLRGGAFDGYVNERYKTVSLCGGEVLNGKHYCPSCADKIVTNLPEEALNPTDEQVQKILKEPGA